MSFSLIGILSVLFESAKPFSGMIYFVLAVEALVWIVVVRGRIITAPWRHRGLAYLAVVVGVLAFVLAPTLTGSSHGHLVGLLDYGVLFLVSIAAGVAGYFLFWGPWLLFGKTK